MNLSSQEFKSLRLSKHTAANRRFQKKYGMSFRDYRAKFLEQEGRCAICEAQFPVTSVFEDGPRDGRAAFPLVVDHSHKSGVVRGLLCGHCNTGLGMFRDSPEALIRAAEYLGRG